MIERIGEDWATHLGHVARYKYAAEHINPDESVKDVACGIGYGSTLIDCREYVGYDKPGVPWADEFPGRFVACDLNATRLWAITDVTICFETLEHVAHPSVLAQGLAGSTNRALFVSVPIGPTMEENAFHLRDFVESDIVPLFEGFGVVDDWAQPEERAHVWWLERP